jgi:hypothetical protein
MHLELSEEHRMIQKTAREFADNEVKPLAHEIDETGEFPHDTFQKAAELGFAGVYVPEEYGGAGFDHVAYSIVIEEISRVCASRRFPGSAPPPASSCPSATRFSATRSCVSGPRNRRRSTLRPTPTAKRSDATVSPSPRPALTPPTRRLQPFSRATATSSTAPRPGAR